MYICPDGDLKFGGENETTCWPPCWRTVALLAAAPFRKPHGVVQMFSACAQLVLACMPVMFWLNTPGIGAGTPGTVGGCVGPVARETSAVGSAACPKLIVRVYLVICVTFTGPMGSPMLLLWPKAPFRAVPE